MKSTKERAKGITLIALVITIIILLLLVGITITQLEGNGLFEKAKMAKIRSDYTSAKEIVELKLMEVQAQCTIDNREYTLKAISESIVPDVQITLEKCYYENSASIKSGLEENFINLKGIVVSVDKYSEYKFLIGKSCKIEKVTIEEITDILDIDSEVYKPIKEFEKEVIGIIPETNNQDKEDNNEDEDKKEEQNNVNGYVQDGLILYLDGIEKIKDTNAEAKNNIWYDLSNSGNNATLYNCINNSNNIGFNGSSSYIALPARALGNYGPSTIEIVSKIENKSVVFADNYSISRRGLGILTNNNFVTSVGGEYSAYSHTTSLNIFFTQHTYALLFDGKSYDTTNVFIDMQVATRSSKSGFSNNSNYPIIGRRIWPTGPIWALKGNIYAIRVYNRQLNQDELTQNYNVDKNRFEF